MLIPSARYPGQVDTSDPTNYPNGKARNVAADNDGTGTPWEKDALNDIWGFFQALVAKANITPSGIPDTAVASQLLNAVAAVAQQRTVGAYKFGTSSVANNALYPLTLQTQFGGFALSSNQIQVPSAGLYRLNVCGLITSTSTSNPVTANFEVDVSPDALLFLSGSRGTATPGDSFAVNFSAMLSISAPGSQLIGIKNVSGVNTAFSTIANAFSSLMLERVQ